MACKEALRITDNQERLLASFEAPEGQAHSPTCNSRQTCSGHSHALNTTLEKFQEPSPFYEIGKVELLTEFREQRSHRSRFMLPRHREIASAVVGIAILVAIIWSVKVWTIGTSTTQRYEEYTVDFSEQPALQNESLPSKVPPAAMPRGRLDLVANLGLGSQPGLYDVVLTRKGTAYGTASGTMRLENGEPVLRVKLDLTQAPAGYYLLGIRPAGWEWRYYKVILKSAHWLGP